MIGKAPTDKHGNPVHIPIPKDLGKPGGPRFMDLLYYHLNLKIASFAGPGQHATKETLEDIYDTILQTTGETMNRTGISRKTCEFLAQRIYESIKFSSHSVQLPSPEDWEHSTRGKHVYDRVPVEQLPPAELRLVAGLFSDSVFAEELRQGIAKLNVRA
jgi:hypothetical protein